MHTLVRSVCGYTSTAYDPFLDISLDLLPMLEAVKRQEAQLTELRTSSQAAPRATAAAAAAAAAASGFEVTPAASARSGQPSVSQPPSSPPSQSGMTDAFSGVEGASFAGASRLVRCIAGGDSEKRQPAKHRDWAGFSIRQHDMLWAGLSPGGMSCTCLGRDQLATWHGLHLLEPLTIMACSC